MALLSSIKPDYEDLVAQLRAQLESDSSWTADLITSATGGALIEAIAQVGAYNQLSIERALQEANLDTARIDSSVYSIARMLGAHIERRTPAVTIVSLVRPDSTYTLEIPAFSQFSLGSVLLYNATPITFGIGTDTTSADLYEGVVTTQEIVSDGSSFQTFSLGTIPFAVSDLHIQCIAGTTEYTKIQDGLWSYSPLDTVFYENTTPDGLVEVMFGNNIYGAIPTNGEVITFTYANTNGDKGNQSTTGQAISCLSFPEVLGTPTTALIQGEDRASSEYYKVVAPSTFSAQGRAVSRLDYRGLILTYPGVVDCIITPQADNPLHRLNVTWMNIMGITLITAEPWEEAHWIKFVAWLKPLGIASVKYVDLKAIPVNVNITITIHCFNTADLNQAQATAEAALVSYFEPKINSLGRSMYRTDIEDAVISSFTTNVVDYIVIDLPTINLVLEASEYVELSTISVSTEFTERNATIL